MSDTWHEYNKRYLAIKIKEIQEKLKSYLENERNNDSNKDKNDNSKNDIDINQKNKNQIEDTSFNDTFITDEKNKKKTQNPDFKNSSKNVLSDISNNNYDFVPAIEILSRAFNLSEFEKNMVLLCAAVELDSETSRLCSKIQHHHHDGERNTLTRRICYICFGFCNFCRWSLECIATNFSITTISNIENYELVSFKQSISISSCYNK